MSLSRKMLVRYNLVTSFVSRFDTLYNEICSVFDMHEPHWPDLHILMLLFVSRIHNPRWLLAALTPGVRRSNWLFQAVDETL